MDHKTDFPEKKKCCSPVASLACQTEGEKARSMHCFDTTCHLLHYLEWQRRKVILVVLMVALKSMG
jgi:hypothetical protein